MRPPVLSCDSLPASASLSARSLPSQPLVSFDPLEMYPHSSVPKKSADPVNHVFVRFGAPASSDDVDGPLAITMNDGVVKTPFRCEEKSLINSAKFPCVIRPYFCT